MNMNNSDAVEKAAVAKAGQIGKFKRNRMGTIDFEGKFDGMRKAQEFTVYPMHSDGNSNQIKIQSDTRIGYIDLTLGHVDLSPPYPGGAYNTALAQARRVGKLSQEELFELKANVFCTASGRAGTNGIITADNSGALEVFSEEPVRKAA